MNTAAARTTAVTATRRRKAESAHRGAERRTLTGLIEVAVVFALVRALIAAVVAGAGTAETAATTSIRVEPGETVWEIAASHSAPGQSIAEVVHEISRLNELEDSTLHVGQTLYVPAAPDEALAVASR